MFLLQTVLALRSRSSMYLLLNNITKTLDPYSIDGAISHLNDLLVILPVFYRGKRVAWTANQGHFTEYVTK